MARRRAPCAWVRRRLAAIAVLASSCSASDEYVLLGRVEHTFAAAQARRLEVRNAVGSVRVAPSADGSVSVRAEVSVRESRRAEIALPVEWGRDVAGGLDGEVAAVRSGHLGSGDESDWRIHFTIEAPAALQWDLLTGVGAIEAEAAGNDVTATVGVGAIDLAGHAGRAELHAGTGSVSAILRSLRGGTLDTATGSVELRVEEGELSEALACTAATGGVEIDLPAGTKATVRLTAGVGGIEILGAPDVEVRRHLVGGSAEGPIGGGGPRIEATAGVGGIRLRIGQ
jgi:hypothetical protein